MKIADKKVVGTYRAKQDVILKAKKKCSKTDYTLSETIEILLQDFVKPKKKKQITA